MTSRHPVSRAIVPARRGPARAGFALFLCAAALLALSACAGRAKEALTGGEQALIALEPEKADVAGLVSSVTSIEAYLAAEDARVEAQLAAKDAKPHADAEKQAWADRREKLTAYLRDCVAELVKRGESSQGAQDELLAKLDVAVIRPTREKLDRLAAIQRRVSADVITADAADKSPPTTGAKNGQPAPHQTTPTADADARQAARDAGVSVSDTATLRDCASAAATALNTAIVGFYGDWSPLMKLPKLADPIGNSYRQYVVFASARDVEAIRAYRPVDQSALPGLLATVEQFAWRFPDPKARWDGTTAEGKPAAPAFDGKPGRLVAKEWHRYRRWLAASDAERGRMAEPVLARLGREANGVPERDVLDMVVEDMLAVWGKDMEPAARFRKDVVKPFADAASLTTPSPVAMVSMILGSLILFGGLVFAALRATRANKANASASR
jgi:hypothetical protein